MTAMEEDLRDLKNEFKELQGDVKEIGKKLDKALSDDGSIGSLSKRIQAFELDKLAWKRLIGIVTAVVAGIATVVSFFVGIADKFIK